MSVTPSYDESIPVLTEVLPGASSQPVVDEPAARPAAGAQDDDAWRALEDQVRSSMAPVLDHVVARLASELRAGLQQTVEDVVARAVAQELAHLRTS